MNPPDPRLSLVREGVADAGLEGIVRAKRFKATTTRRCAVSAAPVRESPNAASEQMTQLLFGEDFDVLDTIGDWAFGRGRRDGYVGYVQCTTLAASGGLASHWVKALRTYAFAEPDIKSPAALLISMNSPVIVETEARKFAKIEGAGWVYRPHLAAMGETAADWVSVCEQFVGAPYQWGGRESIGVDCSGLVQAGLHAAGRACPRDSDMQRDQLGEPITARELRRGDLVFWDGHVGVMVDEARLLHANGHHMTTAAEPLDAATARIGRTPTGRPIGYRRLSAH